MGELPACVIDLLQGFLELIATGDVWRRYSKHVVLSPNVLTTVVDQELEESLCRPRNVRGRFDRPLAGCGAIKPEPLDRQCRDRMLLGGSNERQCKSGLG